jgi:hypothetical protein
MTRSLNRDRAFLPQFRPNCSSPRATGSVTAPVLSMGSSGAVRSRDGFAGGDPTQPFRVINRCGGNSPSLTQDQIRRFRCGRARWFWSRQPCGRRIHPDGPARPLRQSLGRMKLWCFRLRLRLPFGVRLVPGTSGAHRRSGRCACTLRIAIERKETVDTLARVRLYSGRLRTKCPTR